MNVEYIIIGDTDKYKDCLVAICGWNKEHAMKVLNRMINEPTKNDILLTKGHYNLRIKEKEAGKNWWNDTSLD